MGVRSVSPEHYDGERLLQNLQRSSLFFAAEDDDPAPARDSAFS
jgi:hypothetical protein